MGKEFNLSKCVIGEVYDKGKYIATWSVVREVFHISRSHHHPTDWHVRLQPLLDEPRIVVIWAA